jgi:hypothetical protein
LQVQADLLEEYSMFFIKKLLENKRNLPYPLRWMCSYIFNLKKSTTESETSLKRSLVVSVIVNGYLLPMIVKPDHLGITTQICVGNKARNNLVQLAKKILEMFERKKGSTEIQKLLDEFANFACSAEDPIDRFLGIPVSKRFEFSDLSRQELLVSTLDIFMLTELIYQNRTSAV